MIAAASFNSASWMSSRLSKRMRSLPKPANHPCVLSTTQRCRPSRSLLSTPLFGNPTGDTPLLQIGAAARVVVAFVSMQLRWPATRLAPQPSDGRQSVDAFLEHHRIVPVRTADQYHQRNASRVYDDVPLGAEFSPVRGVGARLLAPRGLGTDEPSTLARLQSIWSCSRRRTSMAWCSFCHTPAAFQSRSRRQQVMPLPNPSSCGRSSQAMPVCSTNRMPLRAASSLTVRLRAPPLADGTKAGMRGCSCRHSSLLTGLLAMRTPSITALNWSQTVVLAALKSRHHVKPPRPPHPAAARTPPPRSQ